MRDKKIEKVNEVWSSDITYIRLSGGFCYLVVIMDWYSRRILSWRISNSLHVKFCLEALEEALSKYPNPEIFNTDQGSQFTSKEFTGLLEISISMDSKGSWLDNIIVERFLEQLNMKIFIYANIKV